MLLKVFCIFDSKIQMFQAPFFFLHRGEAIRAWESAANDPQSNISKYPADFTLFEIGEYSQSTGEFKNLTAKIPLGTALEFVRPVQGQAPLLDMIRPGVRMAESAARPVCEPAQGGA